nr:unnamed protein product [Digitaria exilis]CAB3472860.1 unnamed protein product [Digitaria exilis]
MTSAGTAGLWRSCLLRGQLRPFEMKQLDLTKLGHGRTGRCPWKMSQEARPAPPPASASSSCGAPPLVLLHPRPSSFPTMVGSATRGLEAAWSTAALSNATSRSIGFTSTLIPSRAAVGGRVVVSGGGGSWGGA